MGKRLERSAVKILDIVFTRQDGKYRTATLLRSSLTNMESKALTTSTKRESVSHLSS
jgi:hypothetical protein